MKTLYFIFVLIISHSLVAQSKVSKADEYYASLNYPMAIEGYEKYVSKAGKSDIEVCTKLANSYYFTNDYLKARLWFDKIYQMQGDGMSETEFIRMITCYKSNRDYEKANEFIKSYYAKNEKKIKMLSFQKKQLDSLKPEVASVSNLSVNTDKADFGATYFGNQIVFSSTRLSEQTTSQIYEWNNQPYLNLFVATQNKNNGQLSSVKDFLTNANSEYHDATIAFSQDLKTVYFTRNYLKKSKLDTDKNGNSTIEILKGTILNDQLIDITSLDFNSKEYSCGHPTLSNDGKWLFFSSNMPGGFGETDIYMCEIFADGLTNTPINLGPMVNTAGREMFPFFNNDSLYFSSDGHYGLGGLDVFITKRKDKTNFSVPENMGEPINSNLDDFSFIFNTQDRNGYFSSNRAGGKGDDDIYSFNLIELPKFIDFSGVVLSKNDNKPIPNATLKLYDAFNDLITEITSDDKGNYSLELPLNSQFTAEFSKPDYSTEVLEITTPSVIKPSDGNDVRLTSFHAIVEKEGNMEKIKVEPIYFEYNKWDITTQGIVELDKVIFAMEKFPKMKIKIESHTDSRGSDKYNLKLSDNRAKSTMDYLISRGVSADRIESAQGYGESRPKNNCTNGAKCSEDEFLLNRRSDFVVIGK